MSKLKESIDLYAKSIEAVANAVLNLAQSVQDRNVSEIAEGKTALLLAVQKREEARASVSFSLADLEERAAVGDAFEAMPLHVGITNHPDGWMVYDGVVEIGICATAREALGIMPKA